MREKERHDNTIYIKLHLLNLSDIFIVCTTSFVHKYVTYVLASDKECGEQ